jgi:hypothetical protein
MEISPALHEIIVAVSRKAVDDRMEEFTVTRQDFGEVRVTIRDLATAQARTEQRMEELAAAQARTEQRMEELAAAQARTEQRMEELAVALQDLAVVQKEVAAVLERFDTRISDLKGWQLELRYQERAVAYFGPLLRRMRIVFPSEMEDELEAHLSKDEFQDLLQLDLLVSGQPRYRPGAPQVWLAVEVSAVVDRHDVERARRRAAILQRAGYRAIPTVAGEQATAGAEEEARIHKTLLLQNGKALFWKDAMEKALSG